jgi:ubiquitin-activating enzyme E1
LIYCYPEDARATRREEDGSVLDIGPFWGGKKRFPNVAALDLADQLHFDYFFSATNLFLFIMGLEPVRDQAQFRSMLASVDLSVADWEPPAETVDVSEEEAKTEEAAASDEDMKEFEQLVSEARALAASGDVKTMQVAEFEKDDDTNFHIDFITASSNMRAWNYRVVLGTRLKTKVIAGKIIAALASTTAMITGLCSLEFYKLVLGLQKDEKQNPYFDTNVNLATATFNSFAVQDAKKEQDGFDPVMQCEIKAVPAGFTPWDFISIDGDLTCEQLMETLPLVHYNVTPSNISKFKITDADIKAGGGGYLYDTEAYSEDGIATMTARATQPISQVYASMYGEIAPTKSFLLLGVDCELDDEMAKIPPIKLNFRKPIASSPQ